VATRREKAHARAVDAPVVKELQATGCESLTSRRPTRRSARQNQPRPPRMWVDRYVTMSARLNATPTYACDCDRPLPRELFDGRVSCAEPSCGRRWVPSSRAFVEAVCSTCVADRVLVRAGIAAYGARALSSGQPENPLSGVIVPGVIVPTPSTVVTNGSSLILIAALPCPHTQPPLRVQTPQENAGGSEPWSR
jgi:hypothetical protein